MKKLFRSFFLLVLFWSIGNTQVNAKEFGDFEYQVESDNTIKITSYNGSSENVVIPSKIEEKKVDAIGRIFEDDTKLKSVTIPGTIKQLPTELFYNCPNLTKVTLNEGIQVISNGFLHSTGVAQLNIPASITHIMGNPFSGDNTHGYSGEKFTVASGNKNYVAVDGVIYTKDKKTLVAYPAFKDGSTFTIPSSVNTIGMYAFYGARNISSITVPSTVKDIKYSAFTGMSSLEKITINGAGETIVGPTVSYCDNLKEIIVNSNNVKSVLTGAFMHLPSLEKITLPNSVTKLESLWAMYNNEKAQYTIPKGLTKLDNGAYAKIYNVNLVDGSFRYNNVSEVFNIVNKERKANGIKALKLDANLTEAAMKRARELVLYFSHTRPNSNDCFTVLKTVHGENIAAGSTTSEAVMKQWMNSPGHKANILNSSFGSMGVGVYKHGNVYYWVQLFSYRDTAAKFTKNKSVPDKSPKEVIAAQFIDKIQVLYEYPYLDYTNNVIELGVGASIKPYRTQGVNMGWKFVAYMLNANSFKYESLNKDIFTVDKYGKITALTAGTGKMKVTLGDKTQVYKVKVLKSIPLEALSLGGVSMELKKGNTKQLETYSTPGNTTENKKLTWKSSNTKVVTVDKKGKIKAVGYGFSIITVKSKNGVSATITVKVPKPIKSVKLNKTEIVIGKNKTYQLKATINPSNTTESKKLTWKSSNTKFVTVDKKGKIKGIKNGVATITVKTANGKTAKVKVVVGTVAAKDIKVSNIKNQYYTGKAIKPNLVVKWGNTALKKGTDYTVTYSNNKKLGKATATIKFKGKYKGSKKITFYIVPNKVSIKNPTTSKKSITVKYNKLKDVKYYQIAYRVAGSNKWKYTTTSSNNKKITKLIKGKKYDVKVRGYIKVSNKNYYGVWSSTKTIKVK